ncbi:MAG: protein kinase [Planctomycetota bacterium]
MTRPPKSGRLKCPKCGKVSKVKQKPAAAGPKPAGARKPPPKPELAPNTEIAGHTIEEYLGGAEYTSSYKASQTSMGRTVLFKLLKPKHAADEKTRGRFFHEARAAARLNHPNLLSVFDMSEEEGLCFYTTEYVAGGTLPAYVRAEGRTTRERLAVAVQIAKALAFAESAGVGRVCIGADDVLVSDKGDVRVQHVGADEPLEGGKPTSTMEAVARLMFLVVTGKELPAGVWNTGSKIPVPEGRDPLGTKLNAAVRRLINQGEETFENVASFAGELEALQDRAQRRSTVDATAAPGGVVPLRLERAHRRELPVKSILVGTVIVAALAGITLFTVLSSTRARRRKKESEELWTKAVAIIDAENPTLDELKTAVEAMQTLASDYTDLLHGQQARDRGLETTRRRLVQVVYDRAERKYPPQELANVRSALRAAHEKLEAMPQLEGFGPVADQLDQRLENARARYHNAATEDWEERVRKKVRAFNRSNRMQYGKAIEEIQQFKDRWSESPYHTNLADDMIEKTRELADERFKEIMKDVGKYVREGRPRDAEDLLRQVVKNFGIEQYVEQARQKLTEI